MDGDLFKKVQKGEPLSITAAAWNAALEAARAHRESVSQQTGGRVGDAADYTVVLVRNDSGAAADRFGVLAIGSPIILPSASLETFSEVVAFEGDEPTGSDGGNWCVLLEPIAPDDIGRAVISGVIPVQVAAGSGAEDYVQPAAGDTGALAFSATGSARVLWQEGTGDPRWALVRLGDGAGVAGLPLEAATWNGTSATQIEDATATIRFDVRDGFQVTLAATGVVLVRIQAAGDTQAGILSTGSQTIAGEKRFTDEVLVVDPDGFTVYYSEPHEYANVSVSKASSILSSTWSVVDDATPFTGDVRQSANSAGASIRFRFNGTEYVQAGILSGTPYIALAAGGYLAIGSDIGQDHTDAFGGEYVGGLLVDPPTAYYLGDLDDVDNTTPTTDDVLTWNGSEWVPGPVPAPAWQSGWDEMAQDAVGGILTDSTEVDFTYNDGAPSITAAIKDNSVALARLVNATAAGVVARLPDSAGAWAISSPTADWQVLFRQADNSLAWGLPDARSRTFRGARAYRSGSGAAPGTSSTWGSVAFDAENYDSDAIHDNSTNNSRMTVPSGMGGYWRFTGRIYPDSVGALAGTVVQVRLLLNGTTVLDQIITEVEPSGSIPISIVQTVRSFSTADYVELQLYHSSGTPMAYYNNDILTWLEAEFLGVAS